MSLIDRIRNKITGILSPHFLGREQIALVEMSGAVLEEAQEQTDESIAGVQAQIDALRSEEGAGLIGIEDAAGNFSSFNVEGALAELAAGGGGGGGLQPSDDATITGEWEFAQPISLLNGAFGATLAPEVLSDDRVYSLQDASGTLAFLSDIPSPTAEVQIAAGANVDVTGSFPSYTISVPNIPEQVNLTAGSNVNITGTYPNLTISAIGGGGGGGDVTSVNGQVGDVVLNAANVGAAPTSHTHTIAQVTGLQNALNGKANTSHTHVIGDVTGLQAALDGKAASSHTHSAADITSGTIARARLGSGTANSDNFLRGDGVWAVPPTGTGGGGGTVTSVQVAGSTGLSFTGGPITASGTITGSLSTNLQSWSGISPSSKANTSHTHTIGNITNLQSSLNAKADASDFTYVGNKSGGSYDSHIGSGDSFAYLWHSAGGQPTDAPFNPTRQGVVLHMGNSWGRVQLAISNETTPQVFVRGAEGSAWTSVWTIGNFDPSSKQDALGYTPANAARTITAGNGLSGGGSLAANRTISLGTPSNITLSSTNSTTTGSHTHAFAPGGTTAQYIRGNGSLATFPTSMAPTAHTHAAGDITSGTFNAARIPNLDASKITAGTLAAARIPSLSSLYVTTSGNQTGISGNKTFTGNITAANVTATSDVRLKEDIEPCPGRKKLLEALRHYRWKWKESGEPGIGVLAQEVQKHAPEYVYEDEEGVLSVDKAGLALEMMFAMIDMLEEFDGSSI